MNSKLLKFSLVCVTGAFVFAANSKTAFAYEEGVAGFTYDKMSDTTQDSSDVGIITSLSSEDIPIPGFSNIGIADVDTNLLIRSGPGENEKVIGKLPKDGGCDILEPSKDDWTKIKSGSVIGYVKSDYLIIGDTASKLALKVGDYIATANSNGLRVRKKPSTDSEVLDQIGSGEDLLVVDAKVVSYGAEHDTWVKVNLGGDDNKDGTIGYVAKEFVDLSYSLKKAVSIDELQFGSEVSSLRAGLVNLAKDHLGEAYVWGGTALGRGVDCSGFTRAIYSRFGIGLPRVSRSQAQGGTTISASNLRPGDLVFYGNSSSGYINHVAIYIGGGRIIHASNPRDGIKTSNLYYRTPVKCVRYINN